MKIFTILVVLLLTVNLNAADSVLTHSLTPKERDFLRNNFSEYLNSKYSGIKSFRNLFHGKFYAPAEFEEAEGVIFAWEGYTYLLTDLIKFVADDYKVLIAVDSEYEKKSVMETLRKNGVNMNNVEFFIVSTDSVWIRDYGPWWIYTEDGDREIVDLIYNRPRPNDDKFPSRLAKKMNIPSILARLITPGGNLILDGHGVAIMTDVVFDPSEGGDPNLTKEDVERYLREYFNVKKVIFLKRMNNDGTGHIDMFCKLLNDTTVIVGEYSSPDVCAPGNYEILNENAKILANETNGLNQPFKVIRIPMPPSKGSGWWGGYTTYSYTNSLIVNKKVLVPIYGIETDKIALDIYKRLMPGYEIKGFDCSGIITANGAIHCITKLIMKDPLEIKTVPLKVARADSDIKIDIEVLSTKKINKDKIMLFWSNNDNGPFEGVRMENISGNKYRGTIPPHKNGSIIYYFIEAENVDGIYETYPEDAPEKGTVRMVISD